MRNFNLILLVSLAALFLSCRKLGIRLYTISGTVISHTTQLPIPAIVELFEGEDTPGSRRTEDKGYARANEKGEFVLKGRSSLFKKIYSIHIYCLCHTTLERTIRPFKLENNHHYDLGVIEL